MSTRRGKPKVFIPTLLKSSNYNAKRAKRNKANPPITEPQTPAEQPQPSPCHQTITELIARRTRVRTALAPTPTTERGADHPEEPSAVFPRRMTADTTSDEEVPETPPSQSPPTPNLYLFHKSPTQDENQSAPDQCEDAEDAEIDDDFQGPAGEAESEIVPEDDVPDVPLNTDEDKRQEVLRKIAAVYWREITAITSLKPVFTFVYYSLNHDYDKTGSHKTRVKGYKRHLISTWNQVEKVQKAYCNMILAWASQKAHLERRFVGLRRTGYLNKHDVPQDKIQLMLPELAARLDVKVSELGIVPEEIGVFYGQVFRWTTTWGEERRGSSHSRTLIPSTSLITGFECLPVPDYVLIVDSVAMCNLFGQSQFTAKYLSTLGPGLVVALQRQPTYNEQCYLAALSHKCTKAIFALMIDWDPYSMDIYMTLRRGSPAFLPENPQPALTRLHFIGPKYWDLKSGGATLYDLDDGMVDAINLLDDKNLPPELVPELETMNDKALRAQADTHRNTVNLAALRLRGLIQSKAYSPESGDSGTLHIPVPEHEEDFEFDLDTVVVPAEMDFDKDDKAGRVTLTYTNADGIQTILERCGDAFMISKYNADRTLEYQIVSTLALVQQLLESKREKLVAQIQKLRKEILMEHEATKDRASECFEDCATHFHEPIPPPPGQIVRPLIPGNVWKKGEPGPEFRALGRASIRRTGYISNDIITETDTLYKALPILATTLDLKVSDLGIAPKEEGVFMGYFKWTTHQGEVQKSSNSIPNPIPQLCMVKDFECRPGLRYVLILDSDALAEVFFPINFTVKYSAVLGWGMVVALRGWATYNERCWLYVISVKHEKAIFGFLGDWDPYLMDIYTTLRTGSVNFMPENPELAIRRLHFLGPTYVDLVSNGGRFKTLSKLGVTQASSAINPGAYRLVPPECKSRLKLMEEKKLRAQATTHNDIVGLALERMKVPIQSNALFPESGDLGILHVPMAKHDDDFELNLESVVPADIEFEEDAESGTLTLTHKDVDGRRTTLQRTGSKLTVSKQDATGKTKTRIKSTLTHAQIALEPEREKVVANLLRYCKEIATHDERTSGLTLQCFEILEARATYFQKLIPPPPERVVAPLKPGDVYKDGEPGPELRALSRAVSYEEFFFGGYPKKELKAKLTTQLVLPPSNPILPQSEPTQPKGRLPVTYKCGQCKQDFNTKETYLEHVRSNVDSLETAASRTLTPPDQATTKLAIDGSAQPTTPAWQSWGLSQTGTHIPWTPIRS